MWQYFLQDKEEDFDSERGAAMEFRVLKYFLAVAREESISRAAEVLHVTQPTLSRQIAQLEEELGASLFMRGKRTTLTEAGVMLRKKAEDILFLAEEIETDFKTRQDVVGEIRIGSGVYAGSNAFLEKIPAFQKKYPGVRFDIYTASADLLKDQMDRGLLDFAVMMEPIEIGSHDFIRLPEKDVWGVLMSPKSPLAQKETVTPQDLKGKTVLMSRRAILQGEFRNWMKAEIPDIAVTYNLLSNALPFARKGALLLTIEAATVNLDPARYTFRPLASALTTSTVLAWRKLNPVFGPAKVFLKFLKEEMKGCHP